MRVGHALILAAMIGLVALGAGGYRSNWRPALFCEALGESLLKYGLFGLAASCNLRAADLSEAQAQLCAEANPAAAAAARDVAARNLETAARILRSQHADEHARRVVRRAWALCPDRADYRAALLAHAAQSGDPGADVRLHDLAFEHEDPHALVLVAGEFQARGKTEDAGGLLRRASELAPDSLTVQVAYARWLLSAGNVAGAEKIARRALAATAAPEETLAAQAVIDEAAGALPQVGPPRAQELAATYGATALVALGYLLALWAPALIGAGRVAARRVRVASESG